MRITNSMMIGQFINNLNKNLKRMETQQYQLATGSRLSRPSQDPVGITRSLQARTELSKIDQHKKNVDDAQAWLTQTESALTEMNSLIVRAYELATDGANETKTAEDKEAIAKEIKQLQNQLLEAANTSYAGRYIFGGYNTTKPPFELKDDGGESFLWYNGEKISNLSDSTAQPIIPEDINGEKIEYEVGVGVKMDISMPGAEMLGVGDENIYAIFNDLYKALNNDNEGDLIDKSITRLQDAQQEVLSNLAEVGGKTNRLDLIKTRMGTDEINYTAIKSNVEDVDHEKVIMEFMMASVVYRSSLSVGARVIQPTLIDFLR